MLSHSCLRKFSLSWGQWYVIGLKVFRSAAVIKLGLFHTSIVVCLVQYSQNLQTLSSFFFISLPHSPVPILYLFISYPLSICLSVCLYGCLYLIIFLSFFLCFSLSFYFSVFLFVCLSVCLSFYLSVFCLSYFLFVSFYVCLSF